MDPYYLFESELVRKIMRSHCRGARIEKPETEISVLRALGVPRDFEEMRQWLVAMAYLCADVPLPLLLNSLLTSLKGQLSRLVSSEALLRSLSSTPALSASARSFSARNLRDELSLRSHFNVSATLSMANAASPIPDADISEAVTIQERDPKTTIRRRAKGTTLQKKSELRRFAGSWRSPSLSKGA